MIAIVLILGLLLLAAPPWRRLSNPGRFWAVAAVLSAESRAGCARPRPAAPPHWSRSGRGAWIGPLILGALPVVFYIVFWIAGPFY
jgi:hypothetical protein